MTTSKLGGFLGFWCLWILSLFGVYKYFEWITSLELLTTTGVLGVCMFPLVMVGEIIVTIFCFGGMNEVLK